MPISIKHKRGSASAITSANPTLAAGELAFETDTRRFKIGDGTTAWGSLGYVTPYVSATDRLLGRSSAGAGDVEEVPCTAFGRSLIGDADAAAARSTLSVQPTASPTFTGVVQADVSNDLLDSRGNLRVFTTDTQAIDKGGSIGLGGKNGFGTFDPWAFGVIKGAKENGTSGNFSGYLAFGTAGAGGTITERLRINSTGQLLVTAGSASAPGVAVSGDTNTGIAQIGGADTISLVTGGSERVRVDASGNVGIGGAPFYSLDVQRTSENAILNVQTTTSGNAQLRIECAGNASSTITQNRTSNNLEITNGSSGSVVITNNGSERLRIDASGRVGVGVTPASAGSSALQVRGDLDIFGNGADRSITYNVGVGDDGITGWYRAKIAFVPSGAANNISQHIAFFNKDGDNGGSTLAERARITAAGEVLIGTTTDNGAYLLQVNSQIYATNATIATSDARFKTNVESLTDATAVIEALRPVAFDFIPHAERNFATERQVGLIAQEAQSALAGTDYAESVVAQCGDHLGLAYEKLVPVLIRALQESNARIAALEERLNHA